MEHFSKEKKYKDYFESRKFKDFLSFRKIKPEDVKLAKEYHELDGQNPNESSKVKTNVHNLFMFDQENSIKTLKNLSEKSDTPIGKKMYEILIHFTENYDHQAANQLARLLESSEWRIAKS